MENKYFTPSIEDIHIGYEFESYWYSTNPEQTGWRKGVVDLNLLKMIKDVKGIRVPYLTKEQIEAEGWKMEYGFVDHLYFSKGRCQLIYFGLGNSIEIQDPANFAVYKGECKCINDFRIIMRLLCIK